MILFGRLWLLVRGPYHLEAADAWLWFLFSPVSDCPHRFFLFQYFARLGLLFQYFVCLGLFFVFAFSLPLVGHTIVSIYVFVSLLQI